MNDAGRARCDELQKREFTQMELHDRLTRMKNMAILCHCSAEIDQGTLLYFSVNNMFLGSGDYLLLLFSETSENSREQDSGMDIYSRVYTYAIIEEEVARSLSGHYTFYSSELDGRLVVLILFHYGLLPAHREGLLYMIGRHCKDIARTCLEKYDMNVMAYVGEIMNEVAVISSAYHKMLSVATLHRYLRRTFSTPVFSMIRPDAGAPSPYELPVREAAGAIANAIVEQGDYHGALTRTLDAMTENPIQSTDELKARFGELFETLCVQLRIRGVRLNVERLRMEQMKLLMDESEWVRPVAWFHQMVDQVASSCRAGRQSRLKQHLEQAQRYIAKHFTDPTLSAREVAEAVGISEVGLSVTFRQQLQTTPARYIRDRRLEQAMGLLNSSECSIQEICGACGFGSLETFHRVFKAEFGITPGQLKRMNRQE